MKRLFSFFAALIMLAAFSFSAFGACVRTDKKLSQSETDTVETMFQTLKEHYGIEAFFVMNYDYDGGDEFRTYARNFLTENAQTEDALVFAVSSANYYMNSRGNAGELLKDEDLDVLYAAIADADEAGEQYKCAVQFYKALDKLLAERSEKTTAISGETTKAQTEQDDKKIIAGSVEIPDEISSVRGDRLVDQADLLNEADETALRKKLDDISENLQFDVVIVTTQNTGSRSPMEFADDYFDYYGFGYGENFDGCVLMISMAERDWWISTCGYGETALSDDYFMEYIRYSKVISKLSNGYYNASFNAFADIVNDFVTEAKTNEPYSDKNRYHEWKFKVAGVCISLAVGLLVGYLVMKSKRDAHVSVIRIKGEAAAYLVGSVQLGMSKDTFLRSNVEKTRRVQRESISSSSSRSSYSSPGSHTSSSGRSHGGGGGKF
ncbi:MAG: TPM domain-containing protein [Clostridia bacterium]|nr:TPM domain-containing protein [Clostridia bacterium]